MQSIIDVHTERWGIKVTAVEVKDVELPASMQRAMARQAEAEREKRARVLLAQGEFQAAQTLADAAALISKEPAALQLRYLQTLIEIGVDKNTTIVFPLPIDLIEPLQDLMRRSASATAHGSNGNTPTPMAPPLQPAQVTGPHTTPAEIPPAPRAQE